MTPLPGRGSVYRTFTLPAHAAAMSVPRSFGERPSKPNMQSVSGAIDPDCRLVSPKLQQLLAYWEARRPAPDRLPGRPQIEPADLRGLLPDLFILDVQREPRVYRYRLFGTELVEAYGRDITGKSLEEVFSDGFRKAATALFDRTVAERRPLRTFGTVIWRGERAMRFEAVHMPLARDGATVDMILGAMVYD